MIVSNNKKNLNNNIHFVKKPARLILKKKELKTIYKYIRFTIKTITTYK